MGLSIPVYSLLGLEFDCGYTGIVPTEMHMPCSTVQTTTSANHEPDLRRAALHPGLSVLMPEVWF